jgi:cytochrome b
MGSEGRKPMDLTHVVLGALLVVAVTIAAVSFVVVARMLRKDEAIDAATFLALRRLEEYMKTTKQPS